MRNDLILVILRQLREFRKHLLWGRGIVSIGVALLLLISAASFAEDVWISKASVSVPQTGLVETILPPELHSAMKSGNLDLKLFGPDSQPRAFELFWREKIQDQRFVLKADKVELRDDRKLVWEATLPEGIAVKTVFSSIARNSFVGKVDVEVSSNSVWIKVAENAALQKSGNSDLAEISFPMGEYQKIRLSFSGYDRSFMATPVFVETVSILGKRTGKDFAPFSFKPLIEEMRTENTLEIRATLPGSGIWIDKLEITTEALFQGTWQVGRESIVLGKREFESFQLGEATVIDMDQRQVRIDIGHKWPAKTLNVKLSSQLYFGQTLDCMVTARLPRMVFVADQPGSYTAQAGLNYPVAVLETASKLDRKPDFNLAFSAAERNSELRPENLLKKFVVKGGPFNSEGYTWKAPVLVNEPGFYRLVLSEKAAFEKNRPGFRLTMDNTQIPYFPGRPEIREIPINAAIDYDATKNNTVVIIKLPAPASQLNALQLNTEGVFDRLLIVEQHVPGIPGWQPWLTQHWTNNNKGRARLTIPLRGFPDDQSEIRITIVHGNNQPLKIDGIQATYYSQDLFFLPTASGPCELFGGNPKASPAVYDLAMIQNQLFDFVPGKVEMGPIQLLSEPSGPSNNLGGPFDGAGYTWVSSFTVPSPGFYQLKLNQQASLEENRNGLRIVKTSLQVPYFAGKSEAGYVDLKVAEEYVQSDNKTSWLITLPGPSSHWSALILTAPGVFERKLSFEIRKPGKLGWKQWQSQTWIGRSESESDFTLDLSRLPKGESEIQLVISHGDNSPLHISKIKASYMTQDLFFYVGEAGEYELAGGNNGAKAPSYDLSLVKNHLLKSEPTKISMGEIGRFQGESLKSELSHVFSEQGWGLYIVLGLVTLVLLTIIVRLFPKIEEEKKGEQESKAEQKE